MGSGAKPDKEVIRHWLLARRGSATPPPPIEQIRAEVYNAASALTAPSPTHSTKHK